MTVITNRTWLPVASALSDFWTNGDGPSGTNTKQALGSAGIESDDIKGNNKREVVANAIKSSPLSTKSKVVTELVDLLAGEQHFDHERGWYQAKKVSKLVAALKEVGGSLLADGTLTWEEDSADQEPEVVCIPAAAGNTSVPIPSPVNSSAPIEKPWGPSIDTLLKVLEQVPAAAAPLTKHRRKDKDIVQVSDEYDVQDFIHMALLMLYKDVRAEESQPSYGGVNSRVDFFIKQDQVVVEAKVAYKNHANKKVSDELIIDIARYSKRPGLKDLVCVVYDLDGSLKNPVGFAEDLKESPSGPLRVHVLAAPWPFSTRAALSEEDDKADAAD